MQHLRSVPLAPLATLAVVTFVACTVDPATTPTPDASAIDGSVADDAAAIDAGAFDAGPAADAAFDGGPADGGPLDAGANTDAGPVDGGGCAPGPYALGARKAVQISASGWHQCARFDDGSLKCWGANSGGELGLGDALTRGSDSPCRMGSNLPFVSVGGVARSFSDVVAFASVPDLRPRTCAISNGDLFCWGDGVGKAPGDLAALAPVALPARAVRFAVNRAASEGASPTACVLLAGGKVACTGANSFGQLGTGDTTYHSDFVVVDLGAGAVATAVSVNAGAVCALLQTGAIKCWGASNYHGISVAPPAASRTNHRGDEPGEMGANLPTLPLPSASAIWGNSGMTCATATSLRCWGATSNGSVAAAAAATYSFPAGPPLRYPLLAGFRFRRIDGSFGTAPAPTNNATIPVTIRPADADAVIDETDVQTTIAAGTTNNSFEVRVSGLVTGTKAGGTGDDLSGVLGKASRGTIDLGF
jgi:hypothetical protein